MTLNINDISIVEPVLIDTNELKSKYGNANFNYGTHILTAEHDILNINGNDIHYSIIILMEKIQEL